MAIALLRQMISEPIRQAGRQAGRQAMPTLSSDCAVHYFWYFNDMPVNSNGNRATASIDFITKQAGRQAMSTPSREHAVYYVWFSMAHP